MDGIMKRISDFAVSLLSLVLFSPLFILAAVLVRTTSSGPVLYWSRRVGRDNRIFWMPKFRTMRTDTPALATHLLENPGHWTTPVGPFLRTTSLDELPQLWSVLIGEMSIVGPRPALFNQHDLIVQRTAREVHRLAPGVTGWAQVNGRDELSIAEKVEFDQYYLNHRSLRFDAYIIILTALKVLRRDGITTGQRTPQKTPDAARREN
jgi:O-antigen biosynthesis protein WbqP